MINIFFAEVSTNHYLQSKCMPGSTILYLAVCAQVLYVMIKLK